MKFDTIVAPTIKELFERKIENMILSGELKIGEKLPTEREMAEQMGISKSIVHNGVKTLERMGFLEVKSRHGIRVANYPETGNVDTLIALFRYNEGKLNRENIISLVQFRDAIENTALTLTIQNYSDKNIERLKNQTSIISEKIRDDISLTNEEIAELLFSYHQCINIISGNTVIPMIGNAFHDISIVFWKIWASHQPTREEIVNYINQFTTLISNKDIEGVIQLLKENNEQFISFL